MLEVEDLYLAYGALPAVAGVSLRLERGERHALIGPNGAGKTSLFDLLAGRLRPDRGRIRLDGRDVTRAPAHRRARLGLARSFQRNNLFAGASVRRNLALADIAARGAGGRFWRPLARDRAAAERVEELAARVGLAEVLEQPVATLAYGMQRQLEVALALAGEPRVLLLDEPTAGMGQGETGRMLALVDALPRNLTVLIIEHDMRIVFGHADRVTVLHQGAVLMTGSPAEVQGSERVRETYLGVGR